MSEACIVRVRNVNEALKVLRNSTPQLSVNWRKISPRGKETLEHDGPYITEYMRPRERVLFSAERDANPFFHFFESLWILAGRQDVAFLQQFVSTIGQFSDDGQVFNAAYGYRLRRQFKVDQIDAVIKLLRRDPDTRQAVLCLWDPYIDLGSGSKDIPCNDLIMLKIRHGALHMTVACRSNDAIWGAYGANAVQFSVLQEFIASAVGVEVGLYRQVSDSFHIYTDNEAWDRINERTEDTRCQEYVPINDLYSVLPDMVPFPLMNGVDYEVWLNDLSNFTLEMSVGGTHASYEHGFFEHVALPMYCAWTVWKSLSATTHRNDGIETACEILAKRCAAPDWQLACVNWLRRRQT